MKTIEIWDLHDGKFFMTLDDILSALPTRARRSSWTVSDYVTPEMHEEYFEAGSEGDNEVSAVANTAKRLRGDKLVSIAKSTYVIWATFRGHEPEDAPEPWITLHAIDSTFWRCETADISTRQALMKAFKDVRLVEP